MFPVRVVKTSGPITFDGCGQLSILVAHLKDISILIILRLEVQYEKRHMYDKKMVAFSLN